MARSMVMRWSMRLSTTCETVEGMVSPPGDPSTAATCFPATMMVGVIELAMRLLGASAFTPLGEKPPMAFDRMTPVSGTATHAPNAADNVVVQETALPCASTTEKCVVSLDSTGAGASWMGMTADDGVALLTSMGGFRSA